MRIQEDRFSAERRMLHDSLLNEFARIVEQRRQRGELTELARERERREFPRLRVSSPDLWIDTVVRFSVIDMSPSGTAMHTSHPVQLDEVLKFALGPIRGADAHCLEITERTAIDDFPGFRREVDRLRDRGFQVAIDDIGTGYSSLQAVSEVHPDFLKVDMSLIRHIDRSLIKKGLVSALVEMGRKIGSRVIAEGIEREEELQALMECGVQYGQGFYFGEPAPAFVRIARPPGRDA